MSLCIQSFIPSSSNLKCVCSVTLCEDKSKLKQYTYACDERADLIFEDIIDISDNVEHDVVEKDGRTYTDHAVVQRDRLRVDSRKWYLSKINPKKYSDKILFNILFPNFFKKIKSVFYF